MLMYQISTVPKLGTNELKNKMIKNGQSQKWEITITEYEENGDTAYKFTRRMPSMAIAETKIFRSKEDAKKQFNEWLQ